MEDRTLMVAPDAEQTTMVPDADRTQMAAPRACPVCGETNQSLSVWCAECGFRLEATPGMVEDAAPVFRLVGAGETHPLHAGDNLVGRLNADVFLSDPSVSRRHAILRVDASGVTVRDENSSNGTRVNGARLAPGEDVPAPPDATVQFGAVTFTVEAPENFISAAPPESLAPAESLLPPEEAPAPTEPAALLVGEDATYALKEGPNAIGRRAGNDVVLADAYVSGRHAVLTLGPDGAMVVDSGSSNGTFLDDRPLAPGVEERLEPGAALRFGRLTFRLEAPAAPDPTEPTDEPESLEPA